MKTDMELVAFAFLVSVIETGNGWNIPKTHLPTNMAGLSCRRTVNSFNYYYRCMILEDYLTYPQLWQTNLGYFMSKFQCSVLFDVFIKGQKDWLYMWFLVKFGGHIQHVSSPHKINFFNYYQLAGFNKEHYALFHFALNTFFVEP